ncbi:hypothetical protein ACHAWF_007696, partial [Thalassiosira exigua]
SFFSTVQTVGSPLVGTLLDRIGPKRTSVLVYGASACSYWALARATSPAGLYLSKVPTLLQHAFLVGQATVASLPGGDGEGGGAAARRAAALGRMTTAYTVGATVGPALGGYLASSDLYAGARLAVWVSLLSVLLSVLFLEDRARERKGQPNETAPDDSFRESARKTLSFLLHPKIGALLFIKFFNGVSSSAFTTAVPLMLANKLRFSTARLGYFMSASSLSVALLAAVGMSPAMTLARNRPDRLAFAGVAGRLSSILAFGAVVSSVIASRLTKAGPAWEETPTEGFALTTFAAVAVSLSSHLHATSLTTLTTGTVTAGERGAILGLEHGLFSMARIIGPSLGTTLLSQSPSPGAVGESDMGGLWRVIMFCTAMDCVLMALLRSWSKLHFDGVEIIDRKSDSGGDMSCKPLVEDHDHSD